jgi:hypothetical protein
MMKYIVRILRMLNIADHFTPIEIKIACWTVADCLGGGRLGFRTRWLRTDALFADWRRFPVLFFWKMPPWFFVLDVPDPVAAEEAVAVTCHDQPRDSLMWAMNASRLAWP